MEQTSEIVLKVNPNILVMVCLYFTCACSTFNLLCNDIFKAYVINHVFGFMEGEVRSYI